MEKILNFFKIDVCFIEWQVILDYIALNSISDGNLDGAVYHYVRALDPVRCLSTLQLIPENSVVAEVEEMEVDRIDGAGTTISQEPESQLTLGLAVLE
jgi:hypothetical protein